LSVCKHNKKPCDECFLCKDKNEDENSWTDISISSEGQDEELDQHIYDVSGEVASPPLERFC